MPKNFLTRHGDRLSTSVQGFGHRASRLDFRKIRIAVLAVLTTSLLIASMWHGRRVQASSFTSTTSGSWGTPATWGQSTLFPGATDNVTIASGTTVTLDTTRSANNLTINSGGALDLNGQQFNFANNATTFTNNGTLTNTAAINEFRFLGNGTPGAILQSFNGAGTYSGNVRVHLNSSVTVNVAALTSLTFNSATNNTNFQIDAGSILDLTNALTVTAPSSGLTYVGIIENGTCSGAGGLKTNGNVNTFGSGTTFTSPFEAVSGAQQGSGTFSGAFKVDSGASVQMVGALTLNSDLTIQSTATLDLNSNMVTFQGNNTTFTNNGTLTNTAAINEFRFLGNGTPGAILQSFNGAGTYSGNVRVHLNSSVTVNVAALTSLTFNSATNNTNFQIDAGSILDLTNALTVTAPSSGLTYVGIIENGTCSGAGGLKTNGNVNTFGSGTMFTSPFEAVSGAQQGSGTFSGAFKIDSGASLQEVGALTLNGDLTIQSTATLDFNGQQMNFQGNGTIFANNGSVINTGAFSSLLFTGISGAIMQHIATSAGTFTDNLLERLAFSITVVLDGDAQLGAVQIDSPSVLDISSHTLKLSGAGTPILNNGTFTGTTASTIEYDGTAAQTVATTNVTYNQLTINNAAGVTLSAAKSVPVTLALMNGVFAIGSNLTMGNNALIRRSAGSLSGTPIFGATVRVNYFGANAIATGTELPASGTVLTTLTMNNSNTVTLSSARTVNVSLVLIIGTFSNGANLTMANGATIQRDNGTLGSGPTFGASANVNYVGATGVTTGPEIPSTSTVLNNLTVNKSGGVTLGGNATVNGTLFLTSGVFSAGSSTLTINNGITVGSGSLASGVTGTIVYNQSSDGQAVLAANYGNLTFSNFNKVLASSGTIGVAGTLTPGSAVAHTITGSTIAFNGAGSQTIPAFTYNNLTSSNSGARTLQASGTIRVASAFTPGANSYTVTGSTVEYNGVIAQALPSTFTPYNNLTINNTAGVNGSGVAGLTVNLLLRVQSGTFTSASTYNIVQIDSGATLAATSGSTINVSGNWTNNGSFTASTGTINLNGSAGRVINGSSATVFNNLTINNAAGVTLGSASTVNGTLILTAGAFTNAANLTMGAGATIKRDAGNLSAAPTFGASVNIEYLGTPAVTTGSEIPVSATVLNNLTDNKAGTVTLGSNATVNGTLTLNSGNITSTALNLLTIGGSGAITRTSGYVLGDLKKTVSGAGAFTFHVGTANGYSPVNANITAGAGSLTIKAVQGPQPNVAVPARALQRYWTLTGAGITTDLTFNYLDPTDIPGTANESIFHLFKYNGTFTDMGAGGLDAANNKYTIAGVSSFSDWTLAEQNAPTEITLEDFSASRVVMEDGGDSGTLLQWRTGTEVSNLGFHIHREEGGKLIRVTRELIAGSALFAGGSTVLTSGRSYSWWDKGSADCGSRIADCQSARYWLEEIDLAGNSKLHGPVAADSRNKLAQKLIAGQAESAVLNDLGRSNSGEVQSDGSAPLEVKAGIPTREPSALSAQAMLTNRATVKLAVRREGWYRMTQAELLAAGLESKIDPRSLQLFVDGIEQSIKVTGEEDGSFDSADSVEFYGIGIDSPYSASRVYLLVAGEKPGRRIAEVQARGSTPAGSSFPYTVERRDRTIYFSSLRNGERENFFGAVVSRGGVDQTLSANRIIQEPGMNAVLEVALQGVTAGSHIVRVQVNGAEVQRVSFSGQEQGVQKITVAESLLREGQNVVTLSALAGDGDVSLVDHLRLTYHRAYTADDDWLVVTATANEQVTIDGFTSEQIRVIDVTNPGEPVELKARVAQAKGSTYTAGVSVAGEGQRRLLAFTEGRAESIAATLQQPSNWRGYTHGADYVILTRGELLESLKPLAALRESQGLNVAMIDVEDLYNEFSYGQKTPQAIKDFLAFAQEGWKKGPRYVLFAGDASYDAKNYLGFGDRDLVPTKLIDTAYLETASDDWFADFAGDGVARIAIGRLPVRTLNDAAAMVSKIIGYERSTPMREALLVADSNDGFDFERTTDQLRELIPANLKVQQIYRGRVDAATAKSQLLEAIARGQKIVNYSGHGSLNQWRGSLLTNEDARALANGDRLPLFVMMTCLNGYFQDAATDSLGEALLKADGGAVAVWASSGMTVPVDQSAMNEELYRLLFNAGRTPLALGDAVRQAKSAISDGDVRRTWVLLGDPAMRLR